MVFYLRRRNTDLLYTIRRRAVAEFFEYILNTFGFWYRTGDVWGANNNLKLLTCLAKWFCAHLFLLFGCLLLLLLLMCFIESFGDVFYIQKLFGGSMYVATWLLVANGRNFFLFHSLHRFRQKRIDKRFFFAPFHVIIQRLVYGIRRDYAEIKCHNERRATGNCSHIPVPPASSQRKSAN